ncbi:MAG TPA: DUF1385 domain-containing protein, partial [Fimbriimonadaceae bacterium]|nr:DUF1385 domain-containing protein [Fimbriimonadaceae bacterium]
MLLFTLYLGASAAGFALFEYAPKFGLSELPTWLYDGLTFGLFLLGMRAIPLSGTHAAEHKVVHALERGEPLELEVVRRMPRVHPRCGTNLAVGASLFLGLAGWQAIADPQLRLLLAAMVTLFVWRPLGNLVQLAVTTKPPTDRQLLGAIRSGEDLIRKVHSRRRMRPSFGERLLATGMPHVLGGSFLMWAIAEGIARLLGFSLMF